MTTTRTAVPAAEITDDERYRWCEELDSLRARVAELEGVIAEHNKRCELECAEMKRSDCCSLPYVSDCDCPRRYMIDTRVKGAAE